LVLNTVFPEANKAGFPGLKDFRIGRNLCAISFSPFSAVNFFKEYLNHDLGGLID